jgi:hypothetical protein
MKSLTARLLQGALIALVFLSAAGCGGLDPTSDRSTANASLTISPVDGGVVAPTCVDGKKYGSCTCKSGGNGVGCGTGYVCTNCDPGFSPNGPNTACHCDTDDVGSTPASPSGN